MKLIKRIVGLICVLAGTLPPHVMYARSEDGNLWNLQLFAMMLAAATISFGTFAVCRLFLDGTVKRLAVGAIASYAAILMFLLVASRITGDLAETMMWMPVILLFGIPFMAPLVAMSGVGSVLVFGDGKTRPEQGAQGDAVNRAP